MAKRRKGGGGRRRRRGGGGRRSGGFAVKDLLMTGALAVGGVFATNYVIENFLPDDIKAKLAANPLIQSGAFVGAGIVGGMLLRRTAPRLARGLALGGIVAGGSAALTHVLNRQGTSGLGLFPVYNRVGQPTLFGLGRGGVSVSDRADAGLPSYMQ